jgi:hypothetical protein
MNLEKATLSRSLGCGLGDRDDGSSLVQHTQNYIACRPVYARVVYGRVQLCKMYCTTWGH